MKTLELAAELDRLAALPWHDIRVNIGYSAVLREAASRLRGEEETVESVLQNIDPTINKAYTFMLPEKWQVKSDRVGVVAVSLDQAKHKAILATIEGYPWRHKNSEFPVVYKEIKAGLVLINTETGT